MKTYSVVIPVYKRFKELRLTLHSILSQSYLPLEVIIVNNNNKETHDYKQLKNYVISKKHPKVNIIHLKSKINSGAIARNSGAKIALGELIAFIDSDVILDNQYAANIINKFDKYENLIAAQGVDTNLQDTYKNIKRSFIRKMIYYFEHFFQTSFLFKKGNCKVLPSLAVTHPSPPFNFEFESEWISTCAGFFKKSIFRKYEFCSQFVTYSWNEYILLSYTLFKKNEGKMIYTSDAKYKGIITSDGRLNPISLQYMAETYDLFIFLNLFDQKKYINLITFLKSRIGRIIYYYLYLIKYSKVHINSIFTPFLALSYALMHLKKIKKGDLSFYKKDFS